ncbi:MAG: RNA polymerase sigma factor [Bacillota bacterium]|nr:RNA polymerase sigma factor [Bacillota bacterium]
MSFHTVMNKELQFEEFYTTYYNQVVSYICRKVSDRNIAEDLAGDIFLKCYKSFDRFNEAKGSARAWIFTITNNRLKNYYRDRKSEVHIDAMESFDIADDQDVAKEIEDAMRLEEIRQFLDREIARLDSVKRQILLMRYYDEMSSNEIAEAMGMSPGNVRVILTRTLKKIKVGADDDIIKLQL